MRTAVIDGKTYSFVSDRSFGLLIGCSTCTATFGAVSGTVTDGTNPIQGASVSADTGQGDVTDGTGSYELTNVAAGMRTITASADGFVAQNQQVNVTDGATIAVNFTLDPQPAGNATIKGAVRADNTGAKLAEVLVETDGESATTNKGGKYNIRDVPAGIKTVTASKDGYETQPMEITVVAGQSITVDFDLVLIE